MSVPSSISSSENRDDGPEPAGVILWCILFLILMRAAFAVQAPAWRDRADIADTTAFLEQARTDDLRVVVLGSSRMQSAFSSEEWARRSDLDTKQVINVSLNSGQFWDARHMLREAGGLPASVQLVLLEAPRWNFNRNKVFPGSNRYRYDYPEHFRQQGGVLDRWSVDDRAARMALLAEFAWPLYQRRSVEEWIEYFRSRREAVPRLPVSAHWIEAMHEKFRAAPTLRADSIVLDHFDDPAMSSFAIRNFDLLIREVRKHGAKVVLVTLPTRDLYQDKIRADPSKGSFVNSIDALIASKIGDGIHSISCKRARDCQLDEDIFVDYGHLTMGGARALTDELFDRVQRLPEH